MSTLEYNLSLFFEFGDCVSKYKFSGFYLLLLIIDLLVFPKFLFSTPLLVFFIPLFLLFIPNFRHSNIIVYFALLIVIVSSVLFGSMEYQGYTSENLKRGIQIGVVFIILLYDFEKIDFVFMFKWLRRILIVYFLMILLLIFIFFFEVDLYSRFMRTFFPESIPMLLNNISHQRFSFHFTDPNAMGYFIVIVLAFLLTLKLPVREHMFYLICALIIVLTTQSRGAMLSYGLVALSYYFLFLNGKASKFYFLSLLVICCFIAFFYLEIYVDNFFAAMVERSDAESALGAGLGGGRIDSWYYFFQNFNYNPFFGVGYSLERDGEVYRPHSDFIRMNLSYGILVYFLFLYMLRGFCIKHTMIIFSFAVPFLINTVIDDYRLFCIFLIFYCLIRSGNKYKNTVAK